MKVSEGFLAADSSNIPKVDYLMLLEYMQENDCYNVAETRSAKTLLASREAYVDTAVGYVEVKREGHLCTVRCRVTPEHKIRGKLYLVTAIIDESAEKIVEVQCNDCPASAGGCKHAICFAMWLIKRSDEPSVTSVTCYWKKPKLAGLVSEHQFISAKNIGKAKKRPIDVPVNININKFTEECTKRGMQDVLFLNYCGLHQPTLNDYSVFNLMVHFLESDKLDHSYDNFKAYCENMLKFYVIQDVVEATKGQSDSKLWHSLRQGRVTASRVYEAIHCNTEDGALVRSILGGYKVPETKAIKRGKRLEKEVIEVLQHDLDTTFDKTGLILISPILGASPDGICNDYVIEIKCPISEKTFKTYVSDNQVTKKFKAQIMLQMHAQCRN